MYPNKQQGYGRLDLLRVAILITVVVATVRLWHLQIIDEQSYRILADQNRFREVDVDAPRGVIYDHNGEILAQNQPSFNVAVVPADLPHDAEGEPDLDAQSVVLDRLLELLSRPTEEGDPTPTPSVAPTPELAPTPEGGTAVVQVILDRAPWVMSREKIEEEIAAGRLGGAYRAVIVATHVTQATAFLVSEDAYNLPGVELSLEPIRDYTTGALTSQVIGYMGHIPEDYLSDYEALGYQQNDQIGLTGLEAAYEDELHGTVGRQTIEVDVNGRRIRTVGEPEPASPGHNLYLTLDAHLQEVATAALQEALDNSSGFTKATQGVVVALDPRNGAIRAMVSLPSYDNNLFTKGITNEGWAALTSDQDHPLFNQAISGRYPPGSIFKIIVASGGLQDGVITTHTKLGDGFDGSNDGIIWLPNEYFPWDRSKDQAFYSWIHKYGYGHGFVTVRDALAVSDDIFFYQLGGGYRDFVGMGVETVGEYAREFGLGAKTGIELPGEDPGLVPDTKWKRLNYAENWLTGDTYNMSIGQGFVLATPLQMANATAGVANRGFLYRPHLMDRITDDDGNVLEVYEPTLIREVAVDPQDLDTVREGMYGAVNWPNGTALNVKVSGVTIAGKTGTAEFYRDDNKDMMPDKDEKGNLPTHAWFTSFAPYIDPEIVVTVFIANGGEGSAAAAPVAAKVLQAYFEDQQSDAVQVEENPAGGSSEALTPGPAD